MISRIPASSAANGAFSELGAFSIGSLDRASLARQRRENHRLRRAPQNRPSRLMQLWLTNPYRPTCSPAADHVGGLFGDHDGGGIGVGRDQQRHDRGIADAQALDAVELEVGRHHRQLVRAPWRRCRPDGGRSWHCGRHSATSSSSLAQSGPGRRSASTKGFSASCRMISRASLKPSIDISPVVRIGPVVGIDQRRGRGIGARQPHRAARARPQEGGVQRHAGIPQLGDARLDARAQPEMELDVGRRGVACRHTRSRRSRTGSRPPARRETADSASRPAPPNAAWRICHRCDRRCIRR